MPMSKKEFDQGFLNGDKRGGMLNTFNNHVREMTMTAIAAFLNAKCEGDRAQAVLHMRAINDFIIEFMRSCQMQSDLAKLLSKAMAA